ncbi:uncharacterized protein (DUF1800 family) [Neorhizobium galegae]|uniref:DUF1800 domain-containing protein n=1 Tax=Neorhizobium galegae TaxID=399 RepID=UPI001AE62ED8|nr:DUF1800 domain-containing protein [Neorhizobium galegae]MBP2549301.1 uncharacterized protein (DUF1800 family) [Neorhizobium galegae]
MAPAQSGPDRPDLSAATLGARRYGYGLKPGEAPAADVDALMLQLKRGSAAKPRFPRDGITGRRETIGRLLTVRAVEAKAALEGRPNPSLRRETQREAERFFIRDVLGRIGQAVASENGFFERLASFWIDHFSVSARKAYEMRMIVPLFEAEAIRPNLAGSFTELLRAAMLHPAMLTYLDPEQPGGPVATALLRSGKGLNEALARELLELHTLGSDSGYTPDDVRGAALILAGLSLDTRSLQVAYQPPPAEPGTLALLGKTYGADGRSGSDHLAMLEDLATRPETARNISTKLVRHFIADQPPPEIVDQMVAAWAESGGNLSAVYRAMLEHPRAWSGETGKVIPPFDFVVSGLRAFEQKGGEFSALAKAAELEAAEEAPVAPAKGPALQQPAVARALTFRALARLGQPVWQPPSPAGFPDDVEAWLSPRQLSERLAWARLAARTLGRDLDPSAFLSATLADAARAETREVVAEAPTKVHGVTMVLASPEFNRR